MQSLYFLGVVMGNFFYIFVNMFFINCLPWCSIVGILVTCDVSSPATFTN